MSEIIYPQIPHDEKKSVKLKLDDIEKIKHLYHVEKWNIAEIADKFNVVYSTIKYHLDPEYRREQTTRTIKYIMRCYFTDEKFRKKRCKYGIEFIKNRKTNDKVYRDYDSTLHHKYYLENIDLCKLMGAEYRQKNKEKIKLHNKEYYKDNKDMIKIYSKQYNIDNKEKIKHYKIDNKEYFKNYDKEHYKNHKKPQRNIKYAMRWF